jgi:hypothetical protein
MATTFTTPLMNLVLPVVGPSGQVGPTYATNLNEALEAVDSHDHSSGKGSRITQDGMVFTDSLDLDSNAIIDALSMVFSSQNSPLATANAIYVSDGDLFYNNSSGTQIQLTAAGTINVTSLGTIGGDYSTSSATVTYSDTTKLFLFKQDGTKTADMAFGSIFIYENIAAANYVKIKSAASLAANIDITLPAALPASTLPLSISSTGALSAATITTAQITDSAVTTAKILDSNVTTAKIADGNVTQAKRAALGQQLSSACTSFTSSTTGSYIDITNLTVTITTTGRPVFIGLIADGSGILSRMEVTGTATELAAQIAILSGSTKIAIHSFGSGLSTDILACPVSMFSHIDVPVAGTYTYKAQFRMQGGTGFACYGTKLIAYEL